MKKRYFIVIVCFGIISILNEIMKFAGIEIESYLLQLLISIVFLIPLELLFVFLWKDEKVKRFIRIIAVVLFWFTLACFVLGSILNFATYKKERSSFAALPNQITVLSLTEK